MQEECTEGGLRWLGGEGRSWTKLNVAVAVPQAPGRKTGPWVVMQSMFKGPVLYKRFADRDDGTVSPAWSCMLC